MVDNAILLIKIYAGKLKQEHPKIFSEQDIHGRLEYFCTIAFVYCVCVRLSKEVEEELRTPMEMVVQKHLGDWYFASSNAFDDINEFVKNNLLTEENRNKRGYMLFNSAAKWAIENSFIGRATEQEEIDHFIKLFSDIFLSESAGYWSV